MPFYKDVNSLTSTNRPDVTDVDAVVQSLLNLLRTRRGEIAFQPLYGVAIEDKLFDLMDDGTRLEILTDVFDAVDRFEPRVELRRGKSAVIFDQENNSIEVSLVFNILGFSDDDALFDVSQSFQGR